MLRSIGYKSLVVDPNLPFDHKSGTLPNKSGRVIDSNGVAINGTRCFKLIGITEEIVRSLL